ncbi:PAS domain-containing protein [Hymenobacter sp. DH14]|uniref:histidine kinase n=1 Tax=Hymenobacter cyanobacteriorum TaxID=2926463 RepID=A0A9X1VIS7_9BACT|nr:PAS domain-containing protein [Hymenobacter cyanobacteriorum]MCI1187760.1 PAS domain-containing protein [Hymenobacter cyanobacteriorum]
MPALFAPDLDFQLLLGALPAPHAVLAPTGTVLGLNAAACALLGNEAQAAGVANQPLRTLHAALVAAGHVLAPAESWAAALHAAQSGSAQVLAPSWQLPAAGRPGSRYWKATIQPVTAGGMGTAGAIRYHLLRLTDVSATVGPPGPNAEQLQQILASSPAIIATVEGPDHRFAFTNAAYDALTQGRAQLGLPVLECFPELLEQNLVSLLDHVYRTGLTVTDEAAGLQLLDPATGQLQTYYLDYSYQPLRDAAGVVTGVMSFAVDVTTQVLARQQTAQAQVRASVGDLRLRRQAEVLPFITFVTDAQGRTTYMSPQWYQYTGLPPGTGWAEVDTQWPRILHPDDQRRAQSEIAESIESPRLGRVEVRLRGADGQYRWFITEAVPEFGADGQLLRRNGYMLDVHELRETQRHLETKDRLLSQILAQAPAYIAAFEGPRHRYTFFNEGYARVMGQRPRLGATLAQLQPGVEAQGYLALLDNVYRTGEAFIGQEMPTLLNPDDKPGSEQYFNFSFLPMHDTSGRVSGILTFAIDVSERVLARRQAALLAREVDQRDEQLRAITQAMPVFIANFDRHGLLTYLNPYFYEYTGRDPAEPVENGWASLPPDDLSAVQAIARAAMQAGEPWEATFRCRRHDGELRWVQTRAQPYQGPDGELAGFSAATTEVHDLHERTAELARSREDFAALADNMAQLAWMADPRGSVFWYNQRWHDYTGLTSEQMQGHGWQQVHDPVLRDAVNARYLAALRSEQPWEDTFPLRRHDGEFRWFLSRARPIRDVAGKVVRWFGTNTDVTALRQLQQQLAESEEEQRIQAESIPQQVWTARPDGTVDYYNHRTAAYLGVGMEQNGAAHWLSFVHPADRPHMQNRWQAALATQRYYEAEFRLRRYDGEYRWFLGQAQARRDAGGQLLKWYGTNTDVHQLRVLQEQVLHSQARFKQLLETLPQLAWTARPDGSINYCNQRWYDYTGLHFEALKDWNWESVVHPDDMPEALRHWQHSLATGAMLEHEMRWRRHDGAYRWFLVRAESLRDAQGNISTWVGANTDVHDFRQVRLELEANNARLRRTNEDLDNFVYTASHDLKQPINNMAGIFAELTRSANFDDPEAQKLIGYFERALARIFATIDDLGAIVQVQRLEQEVPPGPVDLAPLVDEVLDGLHDQMVQCRALVECDFATYPVVSFVRPNLHSIFQNLLSNSLRYASPARPPRIRLSSAPDVTTGRPVITVQDNGLGIDLDRYGPQLFQLFRRFHSHVDGTGMGLYLVNRIVQNHGGRIEVSSAVDEGTTFQLYL